MSTQVSIEESGVPMFSGEYKVHLEVTMGEEGGWKLEG